MVGVATVANHSQGIRRTPATTAILTQGIPSNRCRFFILGWRQDKEDKEGKKTRGENRTEFGSVKLTSKSRNALFFVLTLPCLLVYLSSLSYLNPNLKKPTLVRGIPSTPTNACFSLCSNVPSDSSPATNPEP